MSWCCLWWLLWCTSHCGSEISNYRREVLNLNLREILLSSTYLHAQYFFCRKVLSSLKFGIQGQIDIAKIEGRINFEFFYKKRKNNILSLLITVHDSPAHLRVLYQDWRDFMTFISHLIPSIVYTQKPYHRAFLQKSLVDKKIKNVKFWNNKSWLRVVYYTWTFGSCTPGCGSHYRCTVHPSHQHRPDYWL